MAEPNLAQAHALELELIADPTLGYASWQNNVPLVRSLAITNRSGENLKQIEVTLTIEPAVADPFVIRFEALVHGETRRIAPIDMKCHHQALASRTELERATLSARALQGDKVLGTSSRSIEILAYDQWAGSRALPELLAAFCAPNDPTVDPLLGKAGRLLASRNLSLNGYQAGSREAVLCQIAAIYSVLAAERISYTNPPASFGSGGQKVRTPERVAAGRVATCLDTALLFASCLEQVGLNCVVLLMKEHAWAGCWLTQTSFGQPTIDDCQSVRKRVDSGELLVFETTLITQQSAASFKSAIARGREYLADEANFEFAIDIAASRRQKILPLPSRAEAHATPTTDPASAPRPVFDELPDLPPLDAADATADLTVSEDTPAGRLARWESKLLDLTLRNRLLNFKPTNSNVELLVPDPALLEQRLAAGGDFRIQPKPSLMEGDDPRDEAVHVGRGAERPLPELAAELLNRRTLLALVDASKLDKHLLEIFTNARLSLEEGGSNTLFLALGFLKWKDTDKGGKAEATYLAPLLLIPVTLKRRSVHSGYELTRHDDDTLVNPTLVHLLRTNYELEVKGIDPLPRVDETAVDVPRIWQAFRRAVESVEGWEVVPKAYLGTFSFTKYLMWKDLHSRNADLKKNRVVAHLIENGQNAYAQDASGPQTDKPLDEQYEPHALVAPMLADSSQLRAIALADAGRDFVLDGPPGTGKSQTITNVISHFLANGKTVLFVSEKIAALNVVHKRLQDVGLGPFCLELHSAKAKKTEVMKQLDEALNFASSQGVDEWEREANRLSALRAELNDLVKVLHHVHPNGLTVYRASGLAILKDYWTEAAFEWTDPNIHDRAALDKLRHLVARISTLGAAFASLNAHPLEGISRTAWSPSWEEELYRESTHIEALGEELENAAAAAAAACGLTMPAPSIGKLTAFDALADLLLRAPSVPAGLASRACDSATQQLLRKFRGHGEARRQVWTSFVGFRPTVTSLNARDLNNRWLAASVTWWPKKAFAQRVLTNVLRAHREDRVRPAVAQVEELLAQLAMLNHEDEALAAITPMIASILGEAFQGLDTDWAALARHEAWCKGFEEASGRFAGSDISAINDVRTKLSALASQHQQLLDPGQATGAALCRFREAFRNFIAKTKAVEELAGGATLCGHSVESGAVARARAKVQRWTAARRQIHPWCLWQQTRSESIAQGLIGVVAALESGAIAIRDVVDYFEYSYQSWWLKRVIDREQALLNFSSAEHTRKIREFREADARFEKLTEAYIVARLAGRVPAAGLPTPPDSELGRLRRDIARQRGLTPIRQVLAGLPSILPKLKPCLLMSPLSVAQYLDAAHAPFDLVVFDEASQIPVWDAVGAIARGNQLVVAGDPMQLPPTSFFHKTSDDDDGQQDGEIQDLESVLDECLAVGLPRQRLNWHYRSRHEGLIAFSNFTYYSGGLTTFPSPVTNDTSVSFRHIPGAYDRGASKTNRAEADAIVAEIETHYLDSGRRKKSMGVVTFNQPQMSLIQTLLDARRRANPELDRILAEIDDEELFIKNLENVQGDERAYILFSVTYGPDSAGKVNLTLGPLTKEGGHRRLNVAISRAREQVIIFSSLVPDQIDPARASGQGVADLKAYLDFARRGKAALLSQSSPTGLEPDSPFEVAVIRALREKGWSIHPQVGCSGYRIDIGVVNPEVPGEYLMGVECDGATYHRAATARDRDRLRQLVLERLGWTLHRIWSTDWWTDAESETEKLDQAIKARLAERRKAGSELKNESPPTEMPTSEQLEVAPRAQYARGPQTTPIKASPLTAPALPLYQIGEALAAPQGKRFEDASSNQLISSQIQGLVENYGPLSEDEVFRRVARAWGFDRVGSRICERLMALRPRTIAVTTKGGRFYWPFRATASTWRGFRVSGDTDESKRHVDEVPLEEIANAAAYLLAHAGATPIDSLARDVSRLFGMARVSSEAQARARKAIELLGKQGRAIADGEVITPVAE